MNAIDLSPPLDPGVLEQAFGLHRLSRLLFAAGALDVAGHIAAGATDIRALAAATGTHAATLKSVLDALVCWGAFARNADGDYGLTAFSQRLVRGAPGAANMPFLLGWTGSPASYDAFGGLLHTLRTGQCAWRATGSADFHAYLAANPETGDLYAKAMEATRDGFARCADAYDFSTARRIVDVGGGHGAFCLEILSRYPTLQAISFDLPDVVAGADCARHPASARLEFAGGDALAAVPAGADIYLTSTVLRCLDDEHCARVLRNVRDAMPDGARLAAFEMVMPEARDNLAIGMADVVARVVYGGRDRTEREFDSLFERAGLRRTRTLPTRGLLSVVEAVAA